MSKYNDRTKAMQSAAMHGWSEVNPVHFDRSVIVQPENAPQYTICPDCQTRDPFLSQ